MSAPLFRPVKDGGKKKMPTAGKKPMAHMRAALRPLPALLFPFLFPLLTAAFVLWREPRGYALFLFAAVALHECGHLAAFLMLGEALPLFRARQFGFLMTPKSAFLSYPREIAVAAAGPLLNLLTAAALIPALRAGGSEANFCFFAINLLTAFFNLLPITGFDGGRILSALSALLLPPRAAAFLSAALSLLFSLLFYFLTLFLFFYGDGSSYPLLLGFFLLGTELSRHGDRFLPFERKQEKTRDFPK